MIVRINPCISYGSILFFEKGVDELDKLLKKMDVYSISVVDNSIFADVLNDQEENDKMTLADLVETIKEDTDILIRYRNPDRWYFATTKTLGKKFSNSQMKDKILTLGWKKLCGKEYLDVVMSDGEIL